MKRLMRAAFPLLVLMACAGSAQAAQIGVHLYPQPVLFRTSLSAIYPGYRDSSSFNEQIGGVADTTAPILLGYQGLVGAPLGADSSFLGRFILSDAGSTGTIDTVLAQVQVSADGNNWIPIESSAGTSITFSLARGTTTNSKVFSRAFHWSNAPTVLTTGAGLIGWPMCRFIVIGDATSNSVIQNLSGYWIGATAADTQSPPY